MAAAGHGDRTRSSRPEPTGKDRPHGPLAAQPAPCSSPPSPWPCPRCCSCKEAMERDGHLGMEAVRPCTRLRALVRASSRPGSMSAMCSACRLSWARSSWPVASAGSRAASARARARAGAGDRRRSPPQPSSWRWPSSLCTPSSASCRASSARAGGVPGHAGVLPGVHPGAQERPGAGTVEAAPAEHPCRGTGTVEGGARGACLVAGTARWDSAPGGPRGRHRPLLREGDPQTAARALVCRLRPGRLRPAGARAGTLRAGSPLGPRLVAGVGHWHGRRGVPATRVVARQRKRDLRV